MSAFTLNVEIVTLYGIILGESLEEVWTIVSSPGAKPLYWLGWPLELNGVESNDLWENISPTSDYLIMDLCAQYGLPYSEPKIYSFLNFK